MPAFGLIDLLMFLLGGGGGNELLDFVPSDAYWKGKGVAITIEALVDEVTVPEPVDIPSLIRDLGAEKYATREAASKKLRALREAARDDLEKAATVDDPEVQGRARELLARLAGGPKASAVRRLMAIRTLGELKDPKALPALRSLLASKDLFVADYALRAIASIEGKPCQRPRATAASRRHDLALVPACCALVAQTLVAGDGPAAANKALENALPMFPHRMRHMARRATTQEQVHKRIVDLAELVGNVRLDSVTLGLGERSHFAVVVARGLYDPEAMKAALRKSGLEVAVVDGLDVLAHGSEARLLPCSGERFVAVFGPSAAAFPIKELVAAIKQKPDKPALDAKMTAVLKSADIKRPLWAVARMTEGYRKVSFLAPFDTMTLSSKSDEHGKLALTLLAPGKDADAVKNAVAEFQQRIKKMKVHMGRMWAFMPHMQPFGELLGSICIQTDEGKVTATATLKHTSAALMIGSMFLFKGSYRRMPIPVRMMRHMLE